MIAAIYCRKSNEQNGTADEAKSVARQEEHGRAYAERKGWTVAEVFSDDGISGAEFAGRPGFVRLMAALKPKPAFNVLIMSEESRLGREMIETSYALKQIVQAGVRVFFYMEDRERTLDSATDKILMAVNAYAGELEREMARHRARDASRQRAAHGFVSGGRCFGYRNVRTADGRVVREIISEEAAIVRRIFEMSRDGKGANRISRVLNAEGAPAPRPQRERPAGWVPSSVQAVLRRPIYRGTLVWGKAMKRDSWGAMKFSARPDSEWLTVDAPHLRIIDEALWEATHERLRTSRLNYLRATNGNLWGKPANGVESKYLLTGMSTCASCGGGMQIYTRQHGRTRAAFYGCPRSRVDRCTNALLVRMETADAAALGIMSEDVLDDAVINRALDKLFERFNGPQETDSSRRKRISASLRKVAKELSNLETAVAAGAASSTVLSGIRERERQQKQLQAELDAVDAAPAVLAAAETLRSNALKALADWKALLGKHTATSRQLLRKLLGPERFVFYPKGKGDTGWYDLGVTPTLDRFFDALPPLKKAMASPAGRASYFGKELRRSLRKAA